jgi:hypothetical protein
MKSNLNEERRKAAPDARDLKNAKEVWKNGETAPSRDTQPAPRSGPLGRVADAGDIGAGTPSVYGTEVAGRCRGDVFEGWRKAAQEAVA